MSLEELFARIEDFGVDFDRFHDAFSQSDNWGGMIHAFEYVTVLGVVESAWKKHREEDRGE